MQAKIIIITFAIFLITNGAPIYDNDDMNNEIDQVHGFIVEPDIPETPVQYPHPEYVAPLFIEEGNGHLHLTGNSLTKSGLAGYIPAEYLEGRLMDLEHFKNNYEVPEEAEFKLIEEAEPIFRIKE